VYSYHLEHSLEDFDVLLSVWLLCLLSLIISFSYSSLTTCLYNRFLLSLNYLDPVTWIKYSDLLFGYLLGGASYYFSMFQSFSHMFSVSEYPSTGWILAFFFYSLLGFSYYGDFSSTDWYFCASQMLTFCSSLMSSSILSKTDEFAAIRVYF